MTDVTVETGINGRVCPRLNLVISALLLFFPAILIGGCAGITSGTSAQTTAQTPGSQTYVISGSLSPVAGGAGATVTLSGTASRTATADTSGNYVFSGLANGVYTVAATHTGYTFTPATQSVTINGADVPAVNFGAIAVGSPSFSVSGTITPAAGGSGTTVSLSGVVRSSTTANATGAFTFNGLPNGAYVITPSHLGYSFAPTTQGVTVNGANVTGVNFTDTVQQTFSISGTISPTTGGSNATISLTGAASATITSNASGSYTFTGLPSGAYTIIPSNAGFGFTPPSRNATISTANVTGVNFTATAQSTHAVSLSWSPSSSAQVTGYNVYRSLVTGSLYARVNPSVVTSLAYTDTTVQNATTYYFVTTAVDANGNESIFSNEALAQIP